MGKLLAKEKEVVVPGEVLAEGLDYLPSFGTYRKDDKIMANRIGLLTVDGKVIKTIQMAGRYMPKRGDMVIGKVQGILISGWRLDLNSAYSGVLSLQEASHKYIKKGEDLSKYFNLDEYVVCKITNVTSQNLIDLSAKGPGLRKLEGGRILKVNTHKVPRIIGKKGSMVSLVKEHTRCKITVGQNGIVWIQGDNPEDELLAVNAVKKIERESHHSGLTEEVENYLKDNQPKKGGKSKDSSKNKNKKEDKKEKKDDKKSSKKSKDKKKGE